MHITKSSHELVVALLLITEQLYIEGTENGKILKALRAYIKQKSLHQPAYPKSQALSFNTDSSIQN